MAITTRQNRTLVAEDWKRIYQSFQNAEFYSYDFETLRKAMIDYIRLHYPENFNDYVESSEYIALIDLIAWLGQNLAFRTDLNARENFIDTAERRDSVLKLAKLINYYPKRNRVSSGLLKIDSISTTESVYDADGLNLSGISINWNDISNENWQDQFYTILNSCFVNGQIIGKSGNSKIISGVKTDEYSINMVSNARPTLPFSKTINDNQMQFEAISCTSINQEFLYETEPTIGRPFNIVYRSDNLGNSSDNTGFFVMFKQGRMNSLEFTISESTPNRVVNVNVDNINDSDQWLYQTDSFGKDSILWKKVPVVSGINVIYNKRTDRNLYQINSRVNDQVDLMFGDGAFSDIPIGNYRFYYRTGNNLSYRITPSEMQNVRLSFEYVSRTGRIETLSVRASLKYTVSNASPRESLADIKSKAPQQYYTQNRMITGEDYNILPYSKFSSIIKSKAINRTSSGISKYIDLIDSSGKYSRTNMFASDGLLYKSDKLVTTVFSASDAEQEVKNNIFPYLSDPSVKHFYYEKYPRVPQSDVIWNAVSYGTNVGTGFFKNSDGEIIQISGDNYDDPTSFVATGSLLKFVPPSGYYFTRQNSLKPGVASKDGEKTELYTVLKKHDNYGTGLSGSGLISNGDGAVTFTDQIPTGAILEYAIPTLTNTISSSVINETITKIQSNYETFGLGYNIKTRTWEFIPQNELEENSEFSLDENYDLNGSSWILLFKHTTNGVYQSVTRITDYIFESARDVSFYYDKTAKIYDETVNKTLSDKISVLKINSDFSTENGMYKNDIVWYVQDKFIDSDGITNPRKVYVTFSDKDLDGSPDDPDIFRKLVNYNEFVYFVEKEIEDDVVDMIPYDSSSVSTELETFEQINASKNLNPVGKVFYATEENKFYQIVILDGIRTVIQKTDMQRKTGRQSLYFQYEHNSPEYRRINPSSTNIIDMYVLTREYYREYVEWIRDTSKSLHEPEYPSIESLDNEYSELKDIKSISDTIIINPGKFKPLFGNKSEPELQATFKVVKNPSVAISDNEIKTSVVAAISRFFDIENWDFGEPFYFSELSAYLHRVLQPNIVSIIIVPNDSQSEFGDLYQVNAEVDEIVISSATVDNVEIIPAITSVQLGRLV